MAKPQPRLCSPATTYFTLTSYFQQKNKGNEITETGRQSNPSARSLNTPGAQIYLHCTSTNTNNSKINEEQTAEKAAVLNCNKQLHGGEMGCGASGRHRWTQGATETQKIKRIS